MKGNKSMNQLLPIGLGHKALNSGYVLKLIEILPKMGFVQPCIHALYLQFITRDILRTHYVADATSTYPENYQN